MKFEIFNSFGVGMMECHEKSCVPLPPQLKDMSRAGYKFKLDGKSISLKKLLDIIKEWE